MDIQEDRGDQVAVLCTVPSRKRVHGAWVLAWLVLLAPVAQASEATTETEAQDVERIEGLNIPIPQGSGVEGEGEGFGVSQKLNYAYFLSEPTKNQHLMYGFGTLSAVDLATGEVVATRTLNPPGWEAFGVQPDTTIVVDDDRGRVYVAYQHPGTVVPEIATSAGGVSQGHFCAVVAVGVMRQCSAGLHILDAETLEPQGRIRLDSLRVDGVNLAPRILAVHVTPDGRLLLVLADYSQFHYGILAVGGSPSHRLHQNLIYVAEADPDSGTVRWVTRIEGCRSQREHYDGEYGYDLTWRMPYPAAVMHTGLDVDSPAVWVGCHSGSTQVGTMVRIPLDVDGVPFGLPVTVPDASLEPPSPTAAQPGSAPAQQTVFGPDRTKQIIADPSSGRFLLGVVDGTPAQEVWWVFDATLGKFVGTIGIGQVTEIYETLPGIDRVAGRFYLQTPKGLFTADFRRTPLPQALTFPQFAGINSADAARALMVTRTDPDGPARIFVPNAGSLAAADRYLVLQDNRPVAVDPPNPGYEGRTLDLPEAEGVTTTTWDGAARGFGTRALLVGGNDATSRVGLADPTGFVLQFGEWPLTSEKSIVPSAWETAGNPNSPCSGVNREVVLGMVGPTAPAVYDSSGGRATAEPVVVDSAMRADLEAPFSRCSVSDLVRGWEEIWGTALFGAPPIDEPRSPWMLGDDQAECLTADETAESSVGDPVAGLYAAAVQCAEGEVSGYSYVRGANVGDVTVGQALTSFRVYRDPARGIVSRVEAVTRGVNFAGTFRIDSVRAVAESWANGRRQPVPAEQREEGYDPNCDLERTAGSCFKRHVFGVWTPAWSCGPCGDEARLLDGLTRAMGVNGVAKFREPDPSLARGAENGFIAAVSKPDLERFSDLVLNNDLLQTVVPALEILRFAPPNRPLTGGGPRGRQIYQFAGVEVSSSYGIQCLLVYDEAANTCAAPAEAPGSIRVSLSDADGVPLSGGAFEVRQDVDADGVLGLIDTLVSDGACVTAQDGIGTCTFENLRPGTYLVSQVAAPPGYAGVSEPWVSEVASGEQRSVVFTNVSNVSTIDLTATDGDAPLAGAVFAAYPDPDGDGKVAPDTQPAAQCTTDRQGVCAMNVPAGSYVLVQISVPAGLEGIQPVPFAFASGGQVASVAVVNHAPGGPEQPAPAAAPVYTPPVEYAPPVESVSGFTPVDDGSVIEEPAVSVPERIGGTVTQVIRAPGDALRLLTRDPKQAVAWTAALALFALAAMAVRRRQQARALLDS